jgi:hypothetical protein
MVLNSSDGALWINDYLPRDHQIVVQLSAGHKHKDLYSVRKQENVHNAEKSDKADP